jgi:neutral trehalase
LDQAPSKLQKPGMMKNDTIAPTQQRPVGKRSKLSATMEAEHLYHWRRHFFKENPKIDWEKNELQDALKEQYMKLLNSNFTDETFCVVVPKL